jgi:hypothetical protein
VFVYPIGGIAFVPSALACIKMDGIVFRPFAPARGRIVIHAVWPDGVTIGFAAQFLRVALDGKSCVGFLRGVLQIIRCEGLAL